MITADVMGYPAQWNRLQWIDLSTFSDERGITLNDFNELSIKPFNSNRESVLQEDYVLVLGGGEADKCIAWTTPYTALRYAILTHPLVMEGLVPLFSSVSLK